VEASFDMDHGPFLVEGVPVLTLAVDDVEYDTLHHAVTDTFDKVDPRLLAQDTAVMAGAALLLAVASKPIGKRLTPAEARDVVEKAGLESIRRVIYEGR
jgi:hypothetical protein